MKNIEALIADGGDITIGAIYPIECAATAADNHNTVAMLVRRENETLNALLKRLDKAIGKFYDNDEIVDELNGDWFTLCRQDGMTGRSLLTDGKLRYFARAPSLNRRTDAWLDIFDSHVLFPWI